MSSPYNDDEILQQRLDEIVEDIFSSTEFINFIDSFRIDRNPDADVADDDYDEDNNNNNDDEYEYYYPESLNVTNYFRISSLSAGIIDETLNNYIQNSTTTTFLPSTTILAPDIFVAPSIDSFPYEQQQGEKIDECSICLVDFQNEDDVALLNCNHLFHKACIDEWCARKPDCPNCREKI